MVTLNIDKREVRFTSDEGEIVIVLYTGNKALLKKVTDILTKNLKDSKVKDFKELSINIPEGDK